MGKRSELKAPTKKKAAAKKKTAKKKAAAKKRKLKGILDIGDRVSHNTYEPELEWTIIGIWDTNCEGLRADLSRPDETKKLKIDRISAQLTELKRIDLKFPSPHDDTKAGDQNACQQEVCKEKGHQEEGCQEEES
jgi:hypothetical protein